MAKRNYIMQSRYIRAMFYGKPGSTKTRTVGTATLDARTYPVLWLNAAGNPESIRDYSQVPDIINIEELKDINTPYNWIMQGQKTCKFTEEFGLLNDGPYKSIVVDQVTDIQRLSFDTVMKQPDLGPGDIGKHSDRRDFYGVLGQMVRFAKLYFDLPMHVFMTCLEKQTVNEVTGAVSYSPLLWGQSDTEVPGYALIVSRLVHRAATKKALLKVIEDSTGDETIHSVALFKPSGQYLAKDQLSNGRLGDFMQDPTVTKMMDAIYGKD